MVLLPVCGLVAGGATVLVGSADLDITPPVGYRMAGYFDERLSTGVHNPLLVKAVVIGRGDMRMALVFCDLIGISPRVSADARARAGKETGIPVENIMITCTHAHTGPMFEGVRRDFLHEREVAKSGADAKEKIDYAEFLRGKIVAAIVEASRAMRPCSLFAGEGRLEGFSFNRRYHMTNGTVQTNPGLRNPGIVRPAGPVDPAVGVLQARGADGRPAVTISSFALHCDTCGGTEFGGDYPYFLAETLRREYGAGHMSAFGPGACGDINHVDVAADNRLRGFASSERIGTNLARAVLDTRLEPVSKPSLAVRSKTIRVPLQRVSPEEAAGAMSRMEMVSRPGMPFLEKVRVVKAADLAALGPEALMEVQVYRLDKETAFVCLPGEIFVELGLAIKRQSPFQRTFVLSICNNRPGYVPTRKAFEEGGYEVENSRVAPGGGEMLVSAAVELLNALK